MKAGASSSYSLHKLATQEIFDFLELVNLSLRKSIAFSNFRKALLFENVGIRRKIVIGKLVASSSYDLQSKSATQNAFGIFGLINLSDGIRRKIE